MQPSHGAVRGGPRYPRGRVCDSMFTVVSTASALPSVAPRATTAVHNTGRLRCLPTRRRRKGSTSQRPRVQEGRDARRSRVTACAPPIEHVCRTLSPMTAALARSVATCIRAAVILSRLSERVGLGGVRACRVAGHAPALSMTLADNAGPARSPPVEGRGVHGGEQRMSRIVFASE